MLFLIKQVVGVGHNTVRKESKLETNGLSVKERKAI